MSDCTDEQFAAMEAERKKFQESSAIRPHVPTKGPEVKEIQDLGNTYMREAAGSPVTGQCSKADRLLLGETHDKALHDRAEGLHALTTPTNNAFVKQGPVGPHKPVQAQTRKVRDHAGNMNKTQKGPSSLSVHSPDRRGLGATHDRNLHDRAEGMHAIDTPTNNSFISGSKIQPHQPVHAMTREDRNKQGDSYLRANK